MTPEIPGKGGEAGKDRKARGHAREEAGISESKVDPSKNTAEMLDYYADLVAFFESDPASTLLKLRSFSLYTPRQILSDFLVRFELFKMILDIPGSVFEFGVFNGQGLMSMAEFSAILEPYHLARRIVGFDTFEGFPEVAEQDATSRSDFVRVGGYAVDSFERIGRARELFDRNRYLGHIPKIELVKGDVTETLDAYLETNPHSVAAMLYLDLDIYLPTKHVLDRMLSRVPKGGVVVFDELNMKDFPGETVAVLESLDVGDVELHRLNFCSRISYFRV